MKGKHRNKKTVRPKIAPTRQLSALEPTSHKLTSYGISLLARCYFGVTPYPHCVQSIIIYSETKSKNRQSTGPFRSLRLCAVFGLLIIYTERTRELCAENTT